MQCWLAKLNKQHRWERENAAHMFVISINSQHHLWLRAESRDVIHTLLSTLMKHFNHKRTETKRTRALERKEPWKLLLNDASYVCDRKLKVNSCDLNFGQVLESKLWFIKHDRGVVHFNLIFTQFFTFLLICVSQQWLIESL